MLIDLQLHSTYSDGYLTPSQLASIVAHQGVKITSLTDHNTVGGLEEFRHACAESGIKCITGLELYVKLDHKKMNLLWFNFNEKSPELHKLLRDTQIRRKNQVRAILNKLVKKGFKINIDQVLDKYTHYVPLNHIINDLWAVSQNRQIIKKQLNNKDPREPEIISEYFYNKKIGRLNESYIEIRRVIKLRKKIGGKLILNHPGKHNQLKKDLISKLKKLGIDGIEVLSPHHTLGAIMYAQYLTRELNLIATGGSDFHRYEGKNFPLQNSWEYLKIDSRYLRNIDKIIGKHE